jgi:hypothetical protein
MQAFKGARPFAQSDIKRAKVVPDGEFIGCNLRCAAQPPNRLAGLAQRSQRQRCVQQRAGILRIAVKGAVECFDPLMPIFVPD